MFSTNTFTKQEIDLLTKVYYAVANLPYLNSKHITMIDHNFSTNTFTFNNGGIYKLVAHLSDDDLLECVSDYGNTYSAYLPIDVTLEGFENKPTVLYGNIPDNFSNELISMHGHNVSTNRDLNEKFGHGKVTYDNVLNAIFEYYNQISVAGDAAVGCFLMHDNHLHELFKHINTLLTSKGCIFQTDITINRGSTINSINFDIPIYTETLDSFLELFAEGKLSCLNTHPLMIDIIGFLEITSFKREFESTNIDGRGTSEYDDVDELSALITNYINDHLRDHTPIISSVEGNLRHFLKPRLKIMFKNIHENNSALLDIARNRTTEYINTNNQR